MKSLQGNVEKLQKEGERTKRESQKAQQDLMLAI